MLTLALLLAASATPVAAQTPCDSHAGRLADLNSREELKAFVHCAAAHVEMVGWEQAAQDFGGHQWLDGPIYLFASTLDGTMLFSPGTDYIPGESLWELRDSEGVAVVQEQARIARDFGGGYVYYRLENIQSGAEEPKLSYVLQLDYQGEPAFIGAGLHPQDTHGTCPADTVRASLVYTEQDIETFVGCAAHHLQRNGLQALHDFNSDPRWSSGPTYLFLYDLEDAFAVFNAGQPQVVGTIRDTSAYAEGRIAVVPEMQRILHSHDDSYIYYRFRNPATDEEGRKITYARRVLHNGHEYLLAAGLYVPSLECNALPLARDINTREELQLYVNCGVELLEERGELAFDLFRYHPQWVGGSSYLFVSGSDCRNIFYPLDYLYDESQTCDFVDSAGNLPNQDILDMSTSEAGEGWVDYVWLNPASETLETKSSYIIASTLNDEHVSVGAGLYESELQ
ncbi:MAG: cache domain-containing protein [Anaerolineaceae bacterium]|nr:cache domain-containing protein [Anaerolineaceae bacterium]MDE0327843.1 cache domain-containing protein [Anaerolineaceae bacterium]